MGSSKDSNSKESNSKGSNSKEDSSKLEDFRSLDALRVPDFLEEMPERRIPPEVETSLLSLDFPRLKKCKRIKVSFHATYILDFDGLVPGTTSNRAVMQLIGSELGDKEYFDHRKAISAESIAKASEIATSLKVRVPAVLAHGMVEEWGSLQNVPFIIYEFITTDTEEDKKVAPHKEWDRIRKDFVEKLKSRSISAEEAGPLPFFQDVYAFVDYLKDLATEADAEDVKKALERMEETLRNSKVEPVPPVLIHQDINEGNILCSRDPSGRKSQWCLDAVIDWEGAVVADPRLAWEKKEPWSTLRKLALVTKTRWLAHTAAKGGKLPRCNGDELAEDYEDLCESLVRKGWLPSVALLPYQLCDGEGSSRSGSSRSGSRSRSGSSGSSSGSSRSSSSRGSRGSRRRRSRGRR